MTSLHLHDQDIPDLTGRVAIVTGGASGIGLAASRCFARHGAIVHVLDRSDAHPEDGANSPNIHFQRCDISSWGELSSAFKSIGHVDIAVANAGISEVPSLFEELVEKSDGTIEEPQYPFIDVNFKAVLHFVKLSLAAFQKQGPGGSIVITSSATGYSPEQSLPAYSATKAGVIGLVRALTSTIPYTHGATINTVAPAATITRLLPGELAAPIKAAGAPVSSADHVGLAIAFSATAMQEGQVEGYGRDPANITSTKSRWNGRGILTLGDTWVEMEGPLAKLKSQWFGDYQTSKTLWQQKLTDMRPHVATVNPMAGMEMATESSEKSAVSSIAVTELVDN